MRQAGRLILRLACFLSVALCIVILLQSARVVPPLGVGWGDGARGRAYEVAAAGSVTIRRASGMTAAPPGQYAYGVQSLERCGGGGIHYDRWNMTAGRGPGAAVLGTFTEVRIAPGWPVLASLILPSLWLVLWSRDRRRARTGRCCRNCGYDLRATPDRCPECGQVPAARTAG